MRAAAAARAQRGPMFVSEKGARERVREGRGELGQGFGRPRGHFVFVLEQLEAMTGNTRSFFLCGE